MVKIRVLYVKGCPNLEETVRQIREVLEAIEVEGKIETVLISSIAEAERERFLGSPTVQVEGSNIEPSRRGDPPALGCRVYFTKHGFSGVPPKGMIAATILRRCLECQGEKDR